jgi:hypothetical protein
MVEEATNTVEIEEDERLFSALLRAMYTAKLDVEQVTDIVPLILLSEKYLIATWVPTLSKKLIKALSDQTAAQCIESGLSIEKYEGLAAHLSFYLESKGEKLLGADWYLEYDRSLFESFIRYVVCKFNTLLGISLVLYWVKHNEDVRKKYSFELMEEVQNLSSKERVTLRGSFYPAYCAHIKCSNDKRRVENALRTTAVLGKKCKNYKVRTLAHTRGLWIGFATKEISEKHYSQCGYYLNLGNGKIYQPVGSPREYYIPCDDGAEVEVKLVNNCIYYKVNGKDLGVAFENIRGDLYPAFVVPTGGSLEFI